MGARLSAWETKIDNLDMQREINRTKFGTLIIEGIHNLWQSVLIIMFKMFNTTLQTEYSLASKILA